MAMLSLPLMQSLLPNSTEANLPICCRKGGHHHCSMSEAAAKQASEGIHSAAAKCPFYPQSGTGEPTYPNTLGLAPAAQFYASVSSHPAAGHAQTSAQFRISYARSSQKRGPPSFLS